MAVVTISSNHANGERRVEGEWTIDELKKRWEPITGIPPVNQEFKIYTSSGSLYSTTISPGATLGDIGVSDGWTFQVSDTRPASEQPQFGTEDDKYEMPLEKYEQRDDSVLNWKKANKLGRFANEDGSLKPGSSCTVLLSTGEVVNGTIRYHGAIEGLPAGMWIGVELDSALGKNDGSVRGQRLFQTKPNHGVFVRGSQINRQAEPLNQNQGQNQNSSADQAGEEEEL